MVFDDLFGKGVSMHYLTGNVFVKKFGDSAFIFTMQLINFD